MSRKNIYQQFGLALILTMFFLPSHIFALSYSQEVLVDTPITYWRLGETSGTTVVDQQNLNNAIYQGSPTLGISGCNPYDTDTAVYFAGGTSNYIVKNSFNNFPGTAISSEFWIKSSNTSTSGTPFSYASSTSANEFLIYDYNSLSIYIGGVSIGSGISINDGNWNHIVVTWQSSTGSLIIYKNGLPVFSATHKQGYTIKSGGTLILGQEQDSLGGSFASNQSFIGAMDEVSIYNHILSPTRVFEHYNAVVNPIVPEPSNLLLFAITLIGSFWIGRKLFS